MEYAITLGWQYIVLERRSVRAARVETMHLLYSKSRYEAATLPLNADTAVAILGRRKHYHLIDGSGQIGRSLGFVRRV